MLGDQSGQSPRKGSHLTPREQGGATLVGSGRPRRQSAFPSQILDAAKRSATLLVVMSEGYLAPDWCARERPATTDAAPLRDAGPSPPPSVPRSCVRTASSVRCNTPATAGPGPHA